MNMPSITWVGLPKSQYYRTEHPKTQIVLHHTASGPKTSGDISWWLNDPYRIATAFIISRTGEIKQLFNSRFWAHHLGMSNIYNGIRNKQSIGIELDSWGPLVKVGEQEYASYTGSPVEASNVYYYDAGFRTLPKSSYFDSLGVSGTSAAYYEKYTTEQLNSLRYLLNYLTHVWKIPRDYFPDMWEVSKDAIQGKPGIWTHVSYRRSKTDCHPQRELVNVLKSL